MSSEDMNLSVNGHSKVPPGFRFHPTEEELLHYYLRKKVAGDKIDLDVIRDIDLNKLEPWDIQEKCKIGTTPQNDWYIFSHKDKKYPTGTRTNRATAAGFWKATGRDKAIQSNCRRIGMRKTLVFYGGRAPHGQKSDWIMHEYRLDDNQHSTNVSSFGGGAADTGAEEGWVVCRVFKKKNYHRALKSPIQHNDTVLDNLIKHMGKSSSSSSSFCKEEIEQFSNPAAGFLHLPELDSPSINHPSSNISDEYNLGFPELMQEMEATRPSRDWVAMDRLVASQLNGQPPVKFSGDDDDFAFSFDDHVQQFINMNNNPETLNYGRLLSAADPLCHLSV